MVLKSPTNSFVLFLSVQTLGLTLPHFEFLGFSVSKINQIFFYEEYIRLADQLLQVNFFENCFKFPTQALLIYKYIYKLNLIFFMSFMMS